MSTLSQFAGGARTPKNIVNAFSSGGSYAGTAGLAAVGSKSFNSGALTANTLKTIVSITGAGSLNYLSIATADATSRTMRLKLALDGIVVFDATSGTITNTGNGMFVIGSGTATSGAGFAVEETHFGSSCVIEVASSLTETDMVVTRCIYRTY